MQRKQLSIVIVAYNSDDVIKECLESVLKYNDIGDGLEVIVVDNSPHTKLRTTIGSLELDLDIKYIRNPQNGGFGQGNNIGVSHSIGKVIFFLNADTILTENIFSDIVEKCKKSVVLGFTLTDKGGEVVDSYGFFPELYILNPFFILIKKYNFYLVNKNRFLRDKVWPWGAAFCLLKEDFELAGGFDENMFLCNEEPDLLSRIIPREVQILTAKIIHLEGHTTEKDDDRFYAYTKSLKYYFEKKGANFKLFKLYYVISSCFKVVMSRLLNRDPSRYLMFIKQVLKL